MVKALENAVKECAELAVKKNIKSEDSLKYTQAAVNAANALRVLHDLRKSERDNT